MANPSAIFSAAALQKFTDLLEGEGIQVKRVGIETKAYVSKTGNGDDEGEGGGDNGGNTPDPLEA